MHPGETNITDTRASSHWDSLIGSHCSLLQAVLWVRMYYILVDTSVHDSCPAIPKFIHFTMGSKWLTIIRLKYCHSPILIIMCAKVTAVSGEFLGYKNGSYPSHDKSGYSLLHSLLLFRSWPKIFASYVPHMLSNMNNISMNIYRIAQNFDWGNFDVFDIFQLDHQNLTGQIVYKQYSV